MGGERSGSVVQLRIASILGLKIGRQGFMASNGSFLHGRFPVLFSFYFS